MESSLHWTSKEGWTKVEGADQVSGLDRDIFQEQK